MTGLGRSAETPHMRARVSPRGVALLASSVVFGTALATPIASAREPVVAYVNPDTGAFSLYDVATGKDLAAPALDIGGIVKRFSISRNGRYVVYRDSANRIRLWDRATAVDVSLPGIDVANPPDILSVSDAGLIAFDEGDQHTHLYDSTGRRFVATGLPATNNNRQPALSADGHFLVTTCNTNCKPASHSGSDAFVQDLTSRTNVPFPDDLSGSDQRDEEHPCVNADGSLVGLNITNPTQADVFLYDRGAAQLVPLPGINDPASNDFDCTLNAAGDYLGFTSGTGFRLYHVSTGSFVTLPATVSNAGARPSDGSLSELFTDAGRDGPRRPVIAYVDPTTGVLGLYDSQLGVDLAKPSVPANLTRWAISPDGRYLVYSDPARHHLGLLDRTAGTKLPLPEINVYSNPGSLTVSSTGLIGFDDNANGPSRVYSSALQSFVPTGLPTNNGHRQTRLSGDGRLLATTCLDGLQPCTTPSGGDSDVYLNDLTTTANIPFPDDISGSDGRDENRPCLNQTGSMVGADVGNPIQRDVLVYSRASGTLVPTPGLNDPSADDLFCAIDRNGNFIAAATNTGVLKVYSRSGHGLLMLPSKLVEPFGLVQPSPGSVSVSGSALRVSAGAAASNRISISLSAGTYTVTDTGAPLTAGAGCAVPRYDTVTCGVGGVTSIVADAKDQNDAVTVTAATPATIHGGAGSDTVRGGPAADSLFGDAGNDKLYARDGVTDTRIDCGDGTDSADVDAAEAGGTIGCETVTHP